MVRGRRMTVLAGGCFDILHPGHIVFLRKAKAAGDFLIVLLESDQKVRKLKGHGRPVHTQQERALILKSLRFVDKVILLPEIKTDQEYEDIIRSIKPDIIATTFGASDNHHKIRIAKQIGAKLRYVTKLIGTHSTSKILGE